jgi:PilZ domain
VAVPASSSCQTRPEAFKVRIKNHRLQRRRVWYSALPMPDAKNERRGLQRLPVRLPVSIKSLQGKVQTTGHTRDLSTSGIFLYTDSQISAGSELEMVLILPPELTSGEKRWVCCRASVVRIEDSEDGSDFGVAASIRSMEVLPEIPG